MTLELQEGSTWRKVSRSVVSIRLRKGSCCLIFGSPFLAPEVVDAELSGAEPLRHSRTTNPIPHTDTNPTINTNTNTNAQNPNALPGPLVLLAADAGDGWVPLGPTAAKAGRKVATVFEDPSIVASDIEIYRTHTHELQIVGTGFNKLTRPVLDFEPALDSSGIYVDVRFFFCSASLSANRRRSLS